MAFIIKFVKGVRNHWKKSTFAACGIAYGINSAYEKYEINGIMRDLCTEASKYGEGTIPALVHPKKVVVIVNPAANKRSAQKAFEKYCEPILQLAGFYVEIIKTDSEGHARRYVEELTQLPDAILVAGGDGTVSEALTGLFRRPSYEMCPIGILPVGRTNSVGNKLFIKDDNPSNIEKAKGLGLAALAVVKGKTEKKDVMKIEIIDKDEETLNAKPVYAIGDMQWGAYRDTLSLRDKYWYTGPLRDYSAFLFNSFSNKITRNCSATIKYTLPCSGCNNCYVKRENKPQAISNRRWWSTFIPKASTGKNIDPREKDYSKVFNENCVKEFEIDINPSDFILSTENIDNDIVHRNSQKFPRLSIKLKTVDSGFDFLQDSWGRLFSNEFEATENLDVRTIEILPKTVSKENNEKYYSIDNEAYEVKPIKISLMPRAIPIYTV